MVTLQLHLHVFPPARIIETDKCVTIIIQTTLSFTFLRNCGGGGTKEIRWMGRNLFLDTMNDKSVKCSDPKCTDDKPNPSEMCLVRLRPMLLL